MTIRRPTLRSWVYLLSAVQGLKCNLRVVGNGKKSLGACKNLCAPFSFCSPSPPVFSSQAVTLTKFRSNSSLLMDKTIFPAWKRAFPREKALFEAWKRYIAEMKGPGTAFPCDTTHFTPWRCCSEALINKLCAWRHDMPPPLSPVDDPAPCAPPSRRNVAVVSHAQYILTVTAAPASRVKAALSKAAW